MSRLFIRRCNICPSVSHAELSEDYGDFYSGSYYPDPKGNGYICGKCYSAYLEVKTDYDFFDTEEYDKSGIGLLGLVDGEELENDVRHQERS